MKVQQRPFQQETGTHEVELLRSPSNTHVMFVQKRQISYKEVDHSCVTIVMFYIVNPLEMVNVHDKLDIIMIHTLLLVARKHFFNIFLVIMKQTLHNYQKILKKCSPGIMQTVMFSANHLCVLVALQTFFCERQNLNVMKLFVSIW